MRVIAEPLAEKGFAPFGEELTIPASGRTFFDGALANLARAPRLSPVRTEEFCRSPNGAWSGTRSPRTGLCLVGRLRHLRCDGGEGTRSWTLPITILAQ